MTVPSTPETQQEPLWKRLATAAGSKNGILDSDFDSQRRNLFPRLQSDGASIYIGWGHDNYYSVDIYDRGATVHEYTFDGNLAATVARALERYWGLEQ